MKRTGLTSNGTGGSVTTAGSVPLLAACAAMLAGCIQVRAPEKPIEINLNVNVRQEVVVRLQKDAGDFISQNPELFPQ